MQGQATGDGFGGVQEKGPQRMVLLEVAISLVCYLGLAGVALFAAG